MLKQRVMTSLVLAPIMVGGIFFLPLPYFSLFVCLIVLLGAWEWANLSGFSSTLPRLAYTAVVSVLVYGAHLLLQYQPEWQHTILLLGVVWWCIATVLVKCYPELQHFWQSKWTRGGIGLLVLVPMWVGLVVLKSFEQSSSIIIYLMLIVWGADIGAYAAGRAWGTTKLAPSVSPGKSWAGVYGGMATTAVLACITGCWVHFNYTPLGLEQWFLLFGVTAITFVISVIGDLAESMFKRYRGIKDSSNLLPGHGGVMDRIDSLSAAVPVFALALLTVGIGV